MKLQYHQASYDLLTQKPISPQKAIENFDRYGLIAHEPPHTEEKRAEKAKWRERSLAWTRIDLFQRPVQFSNANIQKLDALEGQYGVKLPAALREWYSLDIAPEIMSIEGWGFMDIDEMKPIKQFGVDWLTHLDDDLWYFLHSEYIQQGGEFLVCRLGDDDNPPVLAESSDSLIEIAARFSEFIYMHLWRWHSQYMFDYGFWVHYHPEIASMRTPSEYHIPLLHLRQNYIELRSNRITWFYDEHSRIQVHTLPDNKDMMVGGAFYTDSLEALKNLLFKIWGDNPPLFRVTTWGNEVSELITELQRERLIVQLRDENDWIKAADLALKLGAYIPVLNSDMAKQLQWLIENGEAEAHPDNYEAAKSEQRYRAKR